MVTQQTPIIDFDHFTFQYYSQAEPTLRDINLKIYAGEKILIVGPSGSGKSTLGHCLNGLIPFYYKGNLEGSLKIQGTETRELDIFKLSKIIGTVLQDSDGQFVGLTVGEDIEIQATGLRPGEKLYEERITEGEGIVPTGHKKIMVLRGIVEDGERLRENIEEMSRVSQVGENDAIRKKLQDIVPEYQPAP